MYSRRFGNTLISDRAADRRTEGFLFGYPSCCVSEFVRRPYKPNGLDRRTQSMLFHWACEECRSTADLIPYYRSSHDSVSGRMGGFDPLKASDAPVRRSLNLAVIALALSGGLLSAKTPADSTHFIALPGDVNSNGLSYAEEIRLGTFDRGFDLTECHIRAALFKARIDSLPDTVQTDRAYKIEHVLRGVVQCAKCGTWVNMGSVTIAHPIRGLQMELPYLALHFMENGYFSYGGDKDFQRADVDTLKAILFPFDAAHGLAVPADSDGDGLTDAEEDSLFFDGWSTIPDRDGDGLPDGPDLAEDLIRLFPKLKEQADGLHSHVAFKPVWGQETCGVCGSVHNMGTIIITNPENGREFEIPYLGLHALAHGHFSYDGSIHPNGRASAFDLFRAMKTHHLHIDGDSDNDGLKDEEEGRFGFDPNAADSDGDGVPDGMDLALTLADSLMALPAVPGTAGPYLEDAAMYGIQFCLICGGQINMGVYRIHNPLINTPSPLEVSHYAFHFLAKGSFAFEGEESGRIDPLRLADFLSVPSGIHPVPASAGPAVFDLRQNHPNPFNSSTMIPYRLSGRSAVSLKLFDIRGRWIRTLVDGVEEPGERTAAWDGLSAEGVPAGSGFYLYELSVDGVKRSGKMLMVR